MAKLKVMSIFGTRPEAIKMAPLVLELSRREGIESLVCVTAQHREMLDSVLDIFGISPKYDLNIMKSSQSLSDITSKVLDGLGSVLSEARPELVLVHGDTTTTFAAALAAFYAKTGCGHVEAGLRTFDRWSPYPEEMNRRLAGQLCTLHFAPTARNAENLRREGVEGGIFVTGNTVIDALGYTAHGEGFESPELCALNLTGRRVVTLTCHRRENYGEPMRQIFSAVRQIAESNPDVLIVYPVHLSPVVSNAARDCLSDVDNVDLISPLSAVDMHRLMAKSYLIMTDSGGIQEEAPALGKPVLVLRRETERPEAVEAGTVQIAGVETDNIVMLVQTLLNDPADYMRMAQAVNPYGDGHACERIVDGILYTFGRRTEPPTEFMPL